METPVNNHKKRVGLAAKRRASDSPTTPHTIVVKGLTDADAAILDAIVDRRNVALAAQGATTSRNAVIVGILREFIAREAST